MTWKYEFIKGPKATIPTLDEAEPGFAKDTNEFFIGSSSGNVQLAKQADLDKTNGQKADKTYVDTQLGYKANQSDLDTTNANVAANTTQLAQKVQKNEVLIDSRDYGAKWDNVTDDTAAIQATIDNALNGSTILVGNSRLHGGLDTGTKSLKFKGDSFINSNYTGAFPASKLYFDTVGVPICIQGTGALSFEDIVVTGANQALGIKVTDNTLSLNNAVIQGFSKGFSVSRGYYNKFVNSYIGFCEYAGTFDNCYNINFVNMSIQATSTVIELLNSSSLTIHGGSIENYTTMGIYVASGSRVNLIGTYFEGNSIANASCVNLEANCAAIMIGCHVYMTKDKYFVYTNSDGIRIYSRNNTFIYPTDTSSIIIYRFKTNPVANNCQVDIAGDNWDTSAGTNVIYCDPQINAQNGIYSIQFPPTHPNYQKSVSTKNDVQKQSFSTPTVEDGTIVTFGNQGFAGDDPIGIHSSAWGYNAYRAIYQKGQWEKIGLRLPNQTDSVAADVATLKTDFNNLLAKLRANGVMI